VGVRPIEFIQNPWVRWGRAVLLTADAIWYLAIEGKAKSTQCAPASPLPTQHIVLHLAALGSELVRRSRPHWAWRSDPRVLDRGETAQNARPPVFCNSPVVIQSSEKKIMETSPGRHAKISAHRHEFSSSVTSVVCRAIDRRCLSWSPG